MKRFPLIPAIAVATLIVVACATAPTLDSSLYTATQTVTAVEASTDAAYKAGLITKAQAQSVSTIAHQVNPLIDSARAAEKADPTGATNTLALVNVLLAGLQAYVPPTPSSAPK
jgi:hypothetical protein